MSRYYDPVTHRFINADGYFQSGGDVLDANMSAYCRNNPIMFVDPTGTHACGDPTCTKCSASRRNFINNNVDWYNKITGSNILGVDSNGDFYYPIQPSPVMQSRLETASKVGDTIGAAIYSAEVTADIGFGVGIEADIEKAISIETLIKDPSLRLEATCYDGYDIGVYSGGSLGVGVCGWDVIGTESSTFNSLVTGEVSVRNEVSNVIGVSAGLSVGVGVSFSAGWNLDYFSKRIDEIW